MDTSKGLWPKQFFTVIIVSIVNNNNDTELVGYPYQTDKDSWRVQVRPLIPITSKLPLNKHYNQEMKGFLFPTQLHLLISPIAGLACLMLEWINDIFPDLIPEYSKLSHSCAGLH